MKLRSLALACLFAAAGFGQTLQTSPTLFSVANDTTYGTVIYHLAKLTSTGAATILATGDTGGIIGIVTGNAGTSGLASVAFLGMATCAFDSGVNAGHYVTSSSTVSGDCHDAGVSKPSTQSIGRVLATGASAGTYQVLIFPPESSGAGTGGGAGSGNATSISGVALSGTAITNGQAWIYNSADNQLDPVAVPYWKKYTVSYSQLTGFAATTGTVTLFARTSRQKVCGVSAFITSAFTGASISAIGTTIGDSNATANFYTPSTISLLDNGAQDFNVMGSAVGSSNVQATFATTGANLSALTGGAVDIDVCVSTLP